MFKRKPLIYDFWADIRFYWKVADYFDKSAWSRLYDGLMKIKWDEVGEVGEKKIQLKRYELNAR